MEKETPSGKSVTERLGKLARRYPFVGSGILGCSFFGEQIPWLSLGEGLPILYIGGHHGMEAITAALLLRFAEELCRMIEEKSSVCGVNAGYLLRHRRICILPLLNPDGAMIAGGGLTPDHPLYPRLRKMNGSDDFSRWQSNGRGVDLNHNYNAGFAEYAALAAREGLMPGPTRYPGDYPESEPETAALCALVRRLRPALSLTLHTQGEEIYASSCGVPHPRSAAIAATAERLTGYRFAIPEGGSAYGGYTDWVIGELGLPSLTVECGKGQNPLPLSDAPVIYDRIRPLLFRAPTLVGE